MICGLKTHLIAIITVQLNNFWLPMVWLPKYVQTEFKRFIDPGLQVNSFKMNN